MLKFNAYYHTYMASFNGSITTTGTSEAIRLDKALFRLHPEFREKAKAAAPGWDVYCLEQEWRDWIAKKERSENLGAAFIAFCRKKYQRKGVSR
jgi:hypothetical protein